MYNGYICHCHRLHNYVTKEKNIKGSGIDDVI